MNLTALDRILLATFPILVFLLLSIHFILENERERGVNMIGDKYTDLVNTTILKNWALRATIICSMNGFQGGYISITKDDVFLRCFGKFENGKEITQNFPLKYVEIMGEKSSITE